MTLVGVTIPTRLITIVLVYGLSLDTYTMIPSHTSLSYERYHALPNVYCMVTLTVQ
jgi:hypothetical protein